MIFRRSIGLSNNPDGASFIIADEMTVKDGDHIIIFLTDRTRVREIERLFQPSPFF